MLHIKMAPGEEEDAWVALYEYIAPPELGKLLYSIPRADH
jgi:hypothetical protein